MQQLNSRFDNFPVHACYKKHSYWVMNNQTQDFWELSAPAAPLPHFEPPGVIVPTLLSLHNYDDFFGSYSISKNFLESLCIKNAMNLKWDDSISWFFKLPETHYLFLIGKMYTIGIVECTECFHSSRNTCEILCTTRRCSMSWCTTDLADL